MSKFKFTQTFYSKDGDSSISAMSGDNKTVTIFASSSYSDVEKETEIEMELDSELVIELAKNLIGLAGGKYEKN